MAALIVKFKVYPDSENPGQVIGKVIEGEYKSKICFLPKWCNGEKVGRIGGGFVEKDKGNAFVLMGVSFEED